MQKCSIPLQVLEISRRSKIFITNALIQNRMIILALENYRISKFVSKTIRLKLLNPNFITNTPSEISEVHIFWLFIDFLKKMLNIIC